MSGRILAVDPGEKRIGIAISDPGGWIATPFKVIKHISRLVDAAAIAEIAAENLVRLILIGQPLDEEGLPNSPEARHSALLAEAVRSQTSIAVELWDESGTTQEAQAIRREMGVSRRKRSGHLDELAAAVILQSYLDAHSNGSSLP
jgi:putative holliday junction resolvase